MINLIYIFIPILIVFSVINMYCLYNKIVMDHFYRITIKSFLKKQYKIGEERYFSSYAIEKIIKILRKNKKKKEMLSLSLARIGGATRVLEKLNMQDLKISLIAHFDNAKALEEFEKLIKKQPQNMFILGELAELYSIEQDISKLNLVVDKIDVKKATKYSIARKLYNQCFLDIRDGDMFTASKENNKILKLFDKNKAFVEKAKAYNLMGIMYKISTLFDTSQFMFEAGKEISEKIENKMGIIEAYGNLSMLMSVQERFEEADDYLDKILELKISDKDKAYVLNKKGLNCLLKNSNENALEFLKEALKISIENDDTNGIAASHEIISYIKYEQKEFEEAASHANEAKKLYEINLNTSALLESKYLQALSRFELKDLENAEIIAREILEIHKQEPTNFHIANAYSLLGKIFAKKGELERAKSLFKESLQLEHRNERIAGIATDYFNIGLVEEKIGQQIDAMKSLESALEYASIFGESNLSEIIKNKIKSLAQI